LSPPRKSTKNEKSYIKNPYNQKIKYFKVGFKEKLPFSYYNSEIIRKFMDQNNPEIFPKNPLKLQMKNIHKTCKSSHKT
jgi:hypothetical protein